MKIQIINTATNGESEVIDFDQLTLHDLKVIIKYCGEIKIVKK